MEILKRQIMIILFILIFLPIVVQANTIVVAKANVYELRCALCHGRNGVAEIPGAPDLTETTLNIDQIMEIIENGQGQMPIIRIDARQRHEAAKYVIDNIRK